MSGALALAGDIRTGRMSARAAVDDALAAIARHAHLDVVTEVLADRARTRAVALDQRIKRGEQVGVLAGVPFAAKNLFDVHGLPTRAGSKINRERAPAVRDAAAIERWEAAGAILVATTAMDEYAYGYTSENAHDGHARNPHDPARTPGGSSGGSAAVVAAGLVPLALGSDTNGSIRVPAALSGCFGLKPTYGRLSRRGAFAFVASLDHVGLFASNVADLAAGYDALQGPDADDPVCAGWPVEQTSHTLEGDVRKLRIAVAGGYFERPMDGAVRAAVEHAATILGAKEQVIIPEAERARAAGFVITTSEAGNLHREILARRPFDLDPLIRDRLFAGALVPAQWYLQAQRFRRWFADALAAILDRIDVVVLPATPCAATPIGADTTVIEDVTMPARLALGLFVQPLTIAGVPITVVATRGNAGLPVGVQLMARAGREDLVLQAAAALERAGFTRSLRMKEPAGHV